MILLQDLGITPEQAAEKAQKLSADSLQQTMQTVIEQVQTNPEGFWHSALQDITTFGLKVVAALVIYFVGSWVIRYIKRLINRIFERRKTEATLASFLYSFITICIVLCCIFDGIFIAS